MSCKINIGSAVASGENSKAITITREADLDNLKKQLEEELPEADVNAFCAVASGKNSSATVLTVIPSSRLGAKKSGATAPKKETRTVDGDHITINRSSAVADKPGQFVCVVPDEPIDPSAQALMDSLKKQWTGK